MPTHIVSSPEPSLTPERMIRARDMYVQGWAVRRILADCRISLGQLYRCLDGRSSLARQEHMEPIPRRRSVIGRRRRAALADPGPLIRRLVLISEHQLIEAGTRLLSGSQAPAGQASDLRVVTTLDRALRDLRRIMGAQARSRSRKHKEPGIDAEADRNPADIDAMRRDLRHKLEAMAAGASAEWNGKT